MKTQKVHIKGMHCKSCELLIEDAFKTIPGIQGVNISHKDGVATLTTSRDIALKDLERAITTPGYRVEPYSTTTTLPAAPQKKSYGELGAITLIIVSAYLLISKLKLIPSFDISGSMGAGTAFVTGLVAAFSSCIAVTGSLLLATSTRYFSLHPEKTLRQRFVLNASFNIGRILSYTLFGALLGLLGGLIAPSPKTMGFIVIIASGVMIILGLKMLHLFPFLERVSFTLPKWIARRVTPNDNGSSYKSSFLLGASTFFLPCGFTQALQLYVISRGSVFEGMLILGVFSLGTLPALISVGALSSITHKKFQYYLSRFAGVLVILVGFTTVQNGFALTGTPSLSRLFTRNSARANVALRNVAMQNGVQVLEMNVNGLDYYPADFTVARGIPVELRVDGRNARGCARVIAIPDLGIVQRLLPDAPTILRFTPTRNRQMTVSCSMGMAGPAFITVVAGDAVTPPATPPSAQKQPCDPTIAQCI